MMNSCLAIPARSRCMPMLRSVISRGHCASTSAVCDYVNSGGSRRGGSSSPVRVSPSTYSCAPSPDFTAGPATLRRDLGRHWTPVHLDFVVADLQVAVERAISAGGVLDRDIVDHRYWRMANLADPSGNGVDLIQLVDGGYEEFVRHTGYAAR